MIQEPQRVALPAVLRQGLVAFREVQGNSQIYQIQDKWKGETYRLEPWQFFVLEVLPVCDDFPKLASVFEDRFGRQIATVDVDELFTKVEEMKLFSPSAGTHPLVASFYKKIGVQLVLEAASYRGTAAKTPGNGGNGKGNGNGNGNGGDVSPGSGTAGASGEKKSGVPAVSQVFTTLDFTADEFSKQHKDIGKLCRMIKSEGYRLSIKAPENSVEWLNELLQAPDLCDQMTARKSGVSSTEEIRRLKEQTEKIKKIAFKNLRIEEQNLIRRLNRLLLQRAYRETPKSAALDYINEEESLSWRLFNPAPLIKKVHPYLTYLRYGAYAVPGLAIIALLTLMNNVGLFQADFAAIRAGLTFASHVVIGLLTDNLLTTLVTALVAHSYRVNVNSFGIVFHFGFFPRFTVWLGNQQQLSRREQIWLHSSSLIVRAGILACCILLWFGTRSMNNFVPQLAQTVSMITLWSLLIVANPLMKSSGYYLLSAVLNEPHLRVKAYMALVGRLRGDVYRKADSTVLAAYAWASFLCMMLVFSFFLAFFGGYLKMHLGGAGMFLLALFILLDLWRMSVRIRQVVEIQDTANRFELWKNRTLPNRDAVKAATEGKPSPMRHIGWIIASFVVVGLLMPYHYEPGGNFVLLPNQKSELTSENGGVVGAVYFNGGETLKKDTVIAKLDTSDYEGKVKIYEAKIREQQAIVDDLKARPKPEEIELAKSELDVRKRQTLFSGQKLKRFEKLFKEHTISVEEFEDQRKQAEVDVEQVKQASSKLELVEAGVTAEEIEAAEAKAQSYQEERNYYVQRIRESLITMPFDGRLEGVNLKLKAGHFLNKGELFAVAENTGQVVAEIEVPEPDIRYVAESEKIRVRTRTFSDTDFNGIVTSIDSSVTGKQTGNVVKVVTLIDNNEKRLQAGMTGYAKVSSATMPVWKVLSLAIVRFFEVEVWSWLP